MFEPDTQPESSGDGLRLGHIYNPLESPQLDNPYPLYARARREEPIFFSELLQSWVITRYDDIRSILRQPDIFSSKDTLRPAVEWAPEVFQILQRDSALFVPTIINTDGKEHQRFRTPLNQPFLPARLKLIEGTIRIVAQRLVDTFYEQGSTELITSFAGPLPQEIMLLLFGIPQADMAQCKRWSDDYLALIYSPLPSERQIECAQSIVAFNAYMGELIEKQRANPGEDVVGSLLTVHADPDRPLSKQEMIATLSGVLMAGHETTTSLIGTSAYLLLSEPERWLYVCQHPEDIPSIIEEIMRFDTMTQAFCRTALQETQVGGVTIPEGALILLSYASGNHDEMQFDHAEQFDLHRSPSQHLSFGHGIHFCVGAQLARMQGRIALEVLSQRFPHMRLQPQHISYAPNVLGRQLKQLLVAWENIPKS